MGWIDASTLRWAWELVVRRRQESPVGRFMAIEWEPGYCVHRKSCVVFETEREAVEYVRYRCRPGGKEWLVLHGIAMTKTTALVEVLTAKEDIAMPEGGTEPAP